MALGLRRCVVSATRGILLHLTENPGIGGGGSADHYGVAAGFADHALGVLGRVDVPIADDGNLHRLFYRGNDSPVGGTGVPLQPRARVHRDAFNTNAFRHFGDLDGDDGVLVPSGAKLDSERNFDGGANGFENFSEERKIAQQAGAATLNDFLGGTAEIDVHGVIAEVFDHACGFGHDVWIRAEELRGDGVLIFLEIEIAQCFGGAAGDAFGAGELRHEQAATAETANDAAEKRVRHASHGGKNRGGADGQVANLERCWKHTLLYRWRSQSTSPKIPPRQIEPMKNNLASGSPTKPIRSRPSTITSPIGWPVRMPPPLAPKGTTRVG